MQFFRSALFPATGEPPVLVSATFKFVPLSALFAEKCLFNFVYRQDIYPVAFARTVPPPRTTRWNWTRRDAGIAKRTERGSGDDRVRENSRYA